MFCLQCLGTLERETQKEDVDGLDLELQRSSPQCSYKSSARVTCAFNP